MKIKAANVLLRFAEPSPAAMLADAPEARHRARPEFSVGSERRARVRILRSRGRVCARPRTETCRGGRPRVLSARRRRCTSTRKARVDTEPRRGRAQGCAGRPGTQAQRETEQNRGLGGGTEGAPAARTAARGAADAALQAGQARARDARGERRVRGVADEPACSAGRVRRDPFDARLPFQSVSVRRISGRHGVRAVRRSARDTRSAGSPGARILDRRRGDDRNRRCFLGARAAGREFRDRHPHCSSRSGDRHAARHSMRSPGPVFPPVYMPGRKITMLPEAVLAEFTYLRASRSPHCRFTSKRAPTGRRSGTRRALERVPVAENLRLDAIDEQFARPATPGEPRWTDELRALWRLAQKLEAGARQAGRSAYRLQLPTSTGTPRLTGRVTIVPRPRGSPLDKLVAETDDSRQQHLGPRCLPMRAFRGSTGRSWRARSR